MSEMAHTIVHTNRWHTAPRKNAKQLTHANTHTQTDRCNQQTSRLTFICSSSLLTTKWSALRVLRASALFFSLVLKTVTCSTRKETKLDVDCKTAACCSGFVMLQDSRLTQPAMLFLRCSNTLRMVGTAAICVVLKHVTCQITYNCYICLADYCIRQAVCCCRIDGA